MQKITDNIYVETDFPGCNISFVVTKEGVVMIDTPMAPTDAIKWRDEIAKHGTVRYLINTEPHVDHFAGSYFFEGTVVGHKGTRNAILSASVDELKGMLRGMAPKTLSMVETFSYRPPAITFSERLTIYLGEHTFELIHMPGHSPFQVAVYVPQERVVFTSDNVTGGVPVFRQALPDEWLDSLKRLQQLDVDTLVPGHGGICKKSFILEMSTRIQAWIDAVTTAIDNGLSLEEAQKEISLLDQYPKEYVNARAAPQMQRMNVARLYKLLKK